MNAETVEALLNAVAPEGRWQCAMMEDGLVVVCRFPGVEGRFGKRIEGDLNPAALDSLVQTWRYQAQYGVSV